MRKRGQLKMSFGMMFSVILIIIFLAVAVYVIIKFMDLQCGIKEESLISNLQNDIDRIWRGGQGSQPVTYNVPSGVDKVCFVNNEVNGKGADKNIYVTLVDYSGDDDNLVLYPKSCGKDNAPFKIEHVNMDISFEDDNPLCFNVKNGKVNMVLKKSSGEFLITILR